MKKIFLFAVILMFILSGFVGAVGEVWVADQNNGQLVKLDGIGNELYRSSRPINSVSVSVDSKGNSWVIDAGLTGFSQVVKLDSLGNISFRISRSWTPGGIAIDTNDNAWVPSNIGLIKFDSDGNELGNYGFSFSNTESIVIDNSDNGVWVTTGIGTIQHFAENGSLLFSVNAVNSKVVGIDQKDGSIWTSDYSGGENYLVEYDYNGTQIFRNQIDQIVEFDTIAVDTEGNVWVGYKTGNKIMKLDENGTELFRFDVNSPTSIAVDENNNSIWITNANNVSNYNSSGSFLTTVGFDMLSSHPQSLDVYESKVWISDKGDSQLVNINKDGSEIFRQGGEFGREPRLVKTEAETGNVILVAYFVSGKSKVMKLDENASEIWRTKENVGNSLGLAISQKDKGIWVTDNNGGVLKFDLNGDKIFEATGFISPKDISVDPISDEAWFIERFKVNKINSSGNVIITKTGYAFPSGVSVNELTEEIWIADRNNYRIVKLDKDGNEQVIQPLSNMPMKIEVDSKTGEVWVVEFTSSNNITRFNENGTQLLTKGGFSEISSISADMTNNTLWLTDKGTNQVIQLDRNGTELLRLPPTSSYTSEFSYNSLMSASMTLEQTLGFNNPSSISVLNELIDGDFDGVLNELDNCPSVYNPDQNDSNENGIGDACELVLIKDETEDNGYCSDGNCYYNVWGNGQVDSNYLRGFDEDWGSVAYDNGNCTSKIDRPGRCTLNGKGTDIVEEYNWTNNFLNGNLTLETKYEIKASATGTFNVSCFTGASWQNLYGDKGTRYPWIITKNVTVPPACLVQGQNLKFKTRIVGGPAMAPTFYYESRIWYYSP